MIFCWLVLGVTSAYPYLVCRLGSIALDIPENNPYISWCRALTAWEYVFIAINAFFFVMACMSLVVQFCLCCICPGRRRRNRGASNKRKPVLGAWKGACFVALLFMSLFQAIWHFIIVGSDGKIPTEIPAEEMSGQMVAPDATGYFFAKQIKSLHIIHYVSGGVCILVLVLNLLGIICIRSIREAIC